MEGFETFWFGIFVSLVVIVLTFFLIYWKLWKISGDTVLLVGLSDSGKTRIFSRLVNDNNNNEPVTYTSLVENVFESWALGDKTLKLVDFPGAERLRKQLIDKWLKKERKSLSAIIFVVDSSTFGKRARDVAAVLYDVALESGNTRILVACNKQDLGLAKSSQVISSTLEKELGLINRSRDAALEATEGGAGKQTLTTTGEHFKWSDLKREMTFVETSAVKHDEFSLSPILSWL